MGEFRSLTLRVSREMINNALKYITKNTDGRNVEFDATEFFLNHVSLRQRTDGIVALLCIAICVRVEFNWKKGDASFHHCHEDLSDANWKSRTHLYSSQKVRAFTWSKSAFIWTYKTK